MKDTNTADKRHGETAACCETLVDCGRASDLTRGLPYQILHELGWPPFNRMYLS